MDDKPITVLKASGEYEPFSEEKVRTALERAGAEDEVVDQVIAHVGGKLYDGISTREIYRHVFTHLRKLQSRAVSRYGLKSAIMQLGPSGFPFEKFVAGILEAYGYEVAVGQRIKGICVAHEIDVIARKDEKHFMIEAKFHNQPGMKSDIQVALYTYARFLDVQQAWVEIAGHRDHFHQPWLVTNTKVTSVAKEYAKCVGLRVISWNYPPRGSLRFMIEESGLHPITCLTSLGSAERRELLEAGMVFSRDLINRKVDFLPRSLVAKARREALRVCGDGAPPSTP
jgi:Holliday junction resolvase-like predicted endonuclease